MPPRMHPYHSSADPSGVRRFALGDNFILVEFTNGSLYRYDATEPGPAIVEHMKQLALAGQGLSTFISQHVREHYAARVR